MSALLVTCPTCKVAYMAGIVGTWSFPPHVCTQLRDVSPLTRKDGR